MIHLLICHLADSLPTRLAYLRQHPITSPFRFLTRAHRYMSAAVRRLAAISSHLSRPQITLARNPLQLAKLGSSYSTQSPNMSGVKEVVDQAIKQNKVAVFGKSWCPVSITLAREAA
jgi:hypothetical protein